MQRLRAFGLAKGRGGGEVGWATKHQQDISSGIEVHNPSCETTLFNFLVILNVLHAELI